LSKIKEVNSALLLKTKCGVEDAGGRDEPTSQQGKEKALLPADSHLHLFI